MRVAALFSCSITTVFLSSIKTDICKVTLSSNLSHFVHEGEPLAISCLLGGKLDLEVLEYNMTWYTAGNRMLVLKEQRSRIQQRGNFIWFLPAVLEDSGSYECTIRNSTHCTKKYFTVEVFQNSKDSCFNEKFAIKETVHTLPSAKVVCPNLDSFRVKDDLLPVVWYKDCMMIKDKRFQPKDDYLVIKNATMEDQGKYTCKMPYYDTGKEYNISRDVHLIVRGSSVIVDCNASGVEFCQVIWTVNDSKVRNFYGGRSNVFEMPDKPMFFEGQQFCTVSLNISKVSDKEYEKPFVCHASNSFGRVAAHITLNRKVPDIQGPLIGVLVTTFVLITVTVFVYHIFKIDIVLWYRNSHCPSMGKEVSDGKIYDAYVLCLTANRMGCIHCLDNFVLKLLPEVLERQCGYNLFIVGRDDLPGQAVVSITDDAIKQSRRLMIILEPELSSCSRLEETSEQQIAVYNALIRYGIQVILIEMDNIQDYTNMPESIQYIKQKHGAIRWKRDFAGESPLANTKFWKHVRYRMPSRRSAALSEFYLSPRMHISLSQDDSNH